MATMFGLPDPDERALLERAIEKWHPELFMLGVRVQVLFATNDGDAPAVKHGGYPALRRSASCRSRTGSPRATTPK
jgi:hypothetical protein